MVYHAHAHAPSGQSRSHTHHSSPRVWVFDCVATVIYLLLLWRAVCRVGKEQVEPNTTKSLEKISNQLMEMFQEFNANRRQRTRVGGADGPAEKPGR